ncbi:hypothetical protein KC622_00935 [Candidatus Dojkabacteria bacterium]|uniref:Uncharacterized protein n=1 Tax=Candidatus Dojkabacteria bacterium TaxID=2099670 RepID=A0A955HWW6_9BACT|nr:hypothetical protein [Candidatus Dojkabacteria bacterium]MCB9790625.1 hypothetical protein [Candidatus Nomurabacteria bacterium]
MRKLPLLEKNAILSIEVSRNSISSVLAYSHYEINRNYLLTDKSVIDSEADPVGESEFWSNYFNALSKKFNWDFLNQSPKDYFLGKIMAFEDEGQGLGAIQIQISPSIKKEKEIFVALHNFLPGADLSASGITEDNTQLANLAEKLGYDELIMLDMNLMRFDLSWVYNSKKDKSWQEFHSKIDWDKKLPLIDAIRDSRLKAFSTMDLENPQIYNKWANFILKPVMKTNDAVIQDLLRSYVTVQLLTIHNNAQNRLNNFAIKRKKSGLILKGDVLGLLQYKQLVLSVLDGLQIRGAFDLLVDYNNVFTLLGRQYSEGINATKFIVTKSVVFDSKDRVYVFEVPGRHEEKKAVFLGSASSVNSKSRDISAVSGEFVIKDLSGFASGESYVFEGSFAKGAYVEGFDKKIEFTSGNEQDSISKVILDTRHKPVTYGPDYRSNLRKFSRWFVE